MKLFLFVSIAIVINYLLYKIIRGNMEGYARDMEHSAANSNDPYSWDTNKGYWVWESVYHSHKTASKMLLWSPLISIFITAFLFGIFLDF